MTVAVKTFMVVLGVALFLVNIISMGKRKMRPSFGVIWSVLALLPIIAAVILRMDMLERYISWEALLAICLGSIALVLIFYSSSVYISELRNQTQELFMQVALLNEENSRLRKTAEKHEAEAERRAEKKRRKAEAKRKAAEERKNAEERKAMEERKTVEERKAVEERKTMQEQTIEEERKTKK